MLLDIDSTTNLDLGMSSCTPCPRTRSFSQATLTKTRVRAPPEMYSIIQSIEDFEQSHFHHTHLPPFNLRSELDFSIEKDPSADQSGSAKWQLPGMKKSLFHWQWHAVFTLALMNTGRDDLFGGLLRDEMGLGKVRYLGSPSDVKADYLSLRRPSSALPSLSLDSSCGQDGERSKPIVRSDIIVTRTPNKTINALLSARKTNGLVSVLASRRPPFIRTNRPTVPHTLLCPMPPSLTGGARRVSRRKSSQHF